MIKGMLEINIILTHFYLSKHKIYISVAILKKKVVFDNLRLEPGFVFFLTYPYLHL